MNAIKRLLATSVASLAATATFASDFGLEFSVERVASSALSVAQCAATIRQAVEDAGYLSRADRDMTTLTVHVSGPRGDGRSLVAYCIEAGDKTVYVVQGLEYAGTDTSEIARVKDRIVAALAAVAPPER